MYKRTKIQKLITGLTWIDGEARITQRDLNRNGLRDDYGLVVSMLNRAGYNYTRVPGAIILKK